jgi:serine/threonine protein phosphatase 1
VGDIHGRLDLLLSAVEGISDHVGYAPFRLVCLGDYVDRGPDSRGVIDFLMALQRRWPVVCLKGNHEELMLEAVGDPRGGRLDRWLDYGGEQTLASYDLGRDSDLSAGIPAEHLRWLASLPSTTGDGRRVYVHAGLMPGAPIHRQKDETFLWIRERFLAARPSEFEAHVVHGHTPRWAGKPDPAAPELLEHRTNLDTGAYATGVLTVGVFDADTPGGPVELITIRGAPAEPVADDPADGSPPRRRGLAGWFGGKTRSHA